MTATHTIIIQLLLGLAQLGNQATNVVPDKWKPVVLGILALASIIQAKLAHKWNPDGTSAAVAYVAKVLLLFLLLNGAAMAQVATPPDNGPTNYVTVSGNFVALNPTSQTTASSNIGAALQLTATLSAGYNQITAPALNRTYRLGVMNFTKPLSAYLGKSLAKKFVFDTSQINLTVQAGAGKVTQTGSTAFNVIAETAGIHISVPVASHLSFQPFGVDWLHGGRNPSNAVFSTGLNFHF